MLHITVGMLVILLVAVGLISLGVGAAASRREAERALRKLEAQRSREQTKLERQEVWRKRKEDVAKKLLFWHRR